MSLTFSVLFVVFVVAVSVRLWKVLEKVENHLDKLDQFLGQQANARPQSSIRPEKRFAQRAGS